ncbi:MAG: hypothetical protein EP347_04960 [Alphaproteobacteria bacterium]|nr:MAG: hypothetical protein EP347_04960 [Alphaproteobacteria bacterium]
MTFRTQIEMVLIALVIFILLVFVGGPSGDDVPAPEEPPLVVEPDPDPAPSVGFSYYDGGDLIPGTGTGVHDTEIYAPGIVFPISNREAYLNSQYFNPGGAGGGGGTQCTAANFTYPWRDNFCETRWSDRATYNCPEIQVHRGVDIRAGTLDDCTTMAGQTSAQHTQIEIVAPEDGYISYVGNYSFNLRAGPRLYQFLHVNMTALPVSEFEEVEAGQVIGYLSNYYTAPTTLHLHLNLQANINEEGFQHVSPYLSMVKAYEAKIGETGMVVHD